MYAQDSSEEERPPYRIDLVAGWNLISFPGDPVDTAIESVIGLDLRVNKIFGFQSGEWRAALRNADGELAGNLTEIRGDLGYWVHAPVAETIEVVLTTTAATALQPRGCGNSEWQLQGVVDVELRPVGTKIDADDYFSRRLDWRVAYGFDTATHLWVKIVPGYGGILETGAGYWMWISSPCGLMP